MIGVPGSRWSGMAQNVEDNIPGFNVTDRTSDRAYRHHSFSGHLGAYFGTGWEHDTSLDAENLDRPFTDTDGTRILKSHEWAYCLDEIHDRYPDSWIWLVHRPDLAAYSWWHEAGGFQIQYPNYSWYKDSAEMLREITKQNKRILEYACKNNATWSYFTPEWVEKEFGHRVEIAKTFPDVLVTVIK